MKMFDEAWLQLWEKEWANRLIEEAEFHLQLMESFAQGDKKFVLDRFDKLTYQGKQHFQKLIDKGDFEKAARQMEWFFPIECNDRVNMTRGDKDGVRNL